MPFRTYAFSKKNVTAYWPQKGLIEAAIGDTVHFRIDLEKSKSDIFLADTAFVDSMYVANLQLSSNNRFAIKGNTALFDYVVTSPAAEWLQVIVDDEVVLRYRLKVSAKL